TERLIGSPLISRSCQLGATGFGSAAGEILAASKTAIERTAKIGGLTGFLNIGLCLLDFALGAVGKRFYSRVRDATILTFNSIRIRLASIIAHLKNFRSFGDPCAHCSADHFLRGQEFNLHN